MSVYLPDNIRPSSCFGVRVGDLPMDFSDNYIDNDKRMLMFHITNPEPEYDRDYTHEVPDEEKIEQDKKITDILDKLYIGQKNPLEDHQHEHQYKMMGEYYLEDIHSSP